jgi:hypothetical protein
MPEPGWDEERTPPKLPLAIALRYLAPSLARRGETNKAASVMRENLAIEPELLLTKLRSQIVVLERLVLELFPRD